jgi:outer membrane lipoprotein SlyB
MRYRTELALLLALPALLAGAAARGAQDTPDKCNACGVVVSIQQSTEQEQWTPLGTVVPGGVSAQSAGGEEMRSAFAFGKDGSRRGIVLVGAAGGAVYAKRPNAYAKPRWDVSVKLDDGSTRVIQQRYEPSIREGDRVRVYGTQLELI